MSNRYCNLTGSKPIKDDFQNIGVGFSQVQADIDKVNTDINSANTKIDSNKVASDKSIQGIQSEINNLSFTGSSHDPLVTASLVDADNENHGPAGNQDYLNGRLTKWEKRQPIVSTTQPTDQPDAGIWYEELSSETQNIEGLVIQNMVVQEDAPTSDTIEIWGDV